MSIAIRIQAHGGPEVLKVEEFEPGRPAAGEVQVRQSAIGLNFIDVYDRTGPVPGAAAERARTRGRRPGDRTRPRRAWIAKVGDRVAYVFSSPGAYTEVRNVPAERLVKVPRGVSDEQAAAMMLKGLTAQFLLRRTYRVGAARSSWCTPPRAGSGLILCQWAKALGAKVIGVVGSEAKAQLARKPRCQARADLGQR